MTKFQREFKRLRKEHGLTQEEMAKALGVSRSTIGNYEQGIREPNFETLELISDFFNVSMGILLEDQQTDCEAYLQNYHDRAYQIMRKLIKLDEADQIRIEERIDILLESEKYK